MNAMVRSAVCVVLLGLARGVVAGESFAVVRVTDMMREETYQVLSSDELKQLQKQLQLEERNFPKAVAQAGEEWRKDELNKTTPFPGGRLSPRKIIGQPEVFPSRDKADERVGQYEDREAKKRAREFDKTGRRSKTASEKLKEERDMEKAAHARRAADLIAAKLVILTGGDATAAPGAKPDDKPVDKKPADKKEAGAALNKAL